MSARSVLFAMPPSRMMPTSSSDPSPSTKSLSWCSWMNFTAAGQRCSIFSFSCRNEAGGNTMRFTSRRGFSNACLSVYAGRRFSCVTKLPCRWQERMRSSSITGVLVASESSKPSCTALTIAGRLGWGSSNHICDFMAKACVRSCMMDEPSP